MSDRRGEIDPRFYRGDRKPVVVTVLELRELLSELPDDLPVMPHESGAALIVYNIKTDAFLAIEDGEDWEQDDEIDRLKAQLKETEEKGRVLMDMCRDLKGRVTELEKDNAHQRERRNAARDCINKMNGPWLLRKKAEGIDEAARELMPRMVGAPDDPMPEFNAACEMCGEFMDYAQRLRNQADEAEQAGGEK